MAKPILMAVDDNPADLKMIQRELLKRYADDYEIICDSSPESVSRQNGPLKK